MEVSVNVELVGLVTLAGIITVFVVRLEGKLRSMGVRVDNVERWLTSETQSRKSEDARLVEEMRADNLRIEAQVQQLSTEVRDSSIATASELGKIQGMLQHKAATEEVKT